MLHVNFNAYASYVTDSLYQWDINQKLVINGLGLSVAPEIHFDNADMDRAIVRQSEITDGAIIVDIPNSLLQSALTIKAYVGVYEGDTFKVIETIEIPVIAKKKPFDYTIEDSDGEIHSFKRLENEIENMFVGAGGLSNRAKTLLIDILRRGTYTENVSNRISELSSALNASDTGGDTGGDNGGNTGGDTGGDNGGSNNGNDNGDTGGDNGNDTGGDNGSGDNTNVGTGDSYEKLVVNASITATSGTAQGVELGNYNNGQRATLLASDGVVKLPIAVSGDMTSYSLIRIPRDTEKVTINGGTEFTIGLFIFELLDGTKFSKKVDTGWINMSENKYVYNISTEYADGNHYIAVNFKMDDASVFDVNSYTDILSLYFGDMDDSGDNGSGDNTGNDNNGNNVDGDISAVLVSAGISNPTGSEIQLANYNNGQRATLVTTDGDIKLSIAVTNETTNYSLIKIPANATALALTGSAEFHYGIGIFAVENNKYLQKVDSGWVDMISDSGEYAIPSEYADGNHYISANFKKDDASVFDVESYKNIITAKFNFA